jgi:hypothetical protein
MMIILKTPSSSLFLQVVIIYVNNPIAALTQSPKTFDPSIRNPIFYNPKLMRPNDSIYNSGNLNPDFSGDKLNSTVHNSRITAPETTKSGGKQDIVNEVNDEKSLQSILNQLNPQFQMQMGPSLEQLLAQNSFSSMPSFCYLTSPFASIEASPFLSGLRQNSHFSHLTDHTHFLSPSLLGNSLQSPLLFNNSLFHQTQ